MYTTSIQQEHSIGIIHAKLGHLIFIIFIINVKLSANMLTRLFADMFTCQHADTPTC